MSWQIACPVSDISEGQVKIVPLGRKGIGIFKRQEEYFAVMNFCPHAGAPLAHGRIESIATSDGPAQPARSEADRPVIRCPWHHWEFDLKTGAAICPIKTRVKVYPVKVENEQVWIDV